ncbi:MAG: 8-amino-7-oxononanoate synthase, partial [Planctomycetes bacterium]|nr:8-amino-7-oxononanoate synthase [Planctomycetota bacterium]
LWMQLDDALRERAAAGLLRSRQVWSPLSPRMVQSSDGCRLIHFGSNDYLCLSWHPGVRSVRSVAGREDFGIEGGFIAGVAELGWNDFHQYVTSSEVDSSAGMLRHGSGASPAITGNTPRHRDLIDAILNLERSESAILFSSGYAANAGTVSALATAEDVVFSDRLNHASLIDGCRLSRAKVIIFEHSDMCDLTEKMHLHRHVGKKAFVLSDSVFSMDGDVADLASILELCEKFDATAILDEAHATGVYGVRGAGLQEHLGIESDRLVRIGTLSKAVGCSGAFVVGPEVLVQWLVNHARPYIYSTSMPLPNAVSACLALELMQGMSREREGLRAKSVRVRESLKEIGHIVGAGDSPIVPVYAKSVREVEAWNARLRERGFFVPGIRPPTVPSHGCLLRISLHIGHTEEDMESLVDACRF